MKILFIKQVLKEIDQRKDLPIVLYGLKEDRVTIISSLKHKNGLEKIGLFHPSRDHAEDPSCLHFYMEEGKLKSSKKFDIDIVNYITQFNQRNHGIIDDSCLRRSSVAMVGVGSGGSAMAEDLIRCGVTNLTLFDFDTVSISNLCRSRYNLFDVGKKKTECVRKKALRINPRVNIRIYDEDVLEMESDKLAQILKDSDLVIEATDSVNTKILINGLAYHHSPVIYPAVYEMGKGGDILFTMPGLPCFECVFKSIMNQLKEVKKGEWDYTTGQKKPMTALLSDIQVIAARGVKIALAILTADTEKSFIDSITEPSCTLLLIGNEKGIYMFDRPFQEVWAETQINPNCTCQTLA